MSSLNKIESRSENSQRVPTLITIVNTILMWFCLFFTRNGFLKDQTNRQIFLSEPVCFFNFKIRKKQSMPDLFRESQSFLIPMNKFYHNWLIYLVTFFKDQSHDRTKSKNLKTFLKHSKSIRKLIELKKNPYNILS